MARHELNAKASSPRPHALKVQLQLINSLNPVLIRSSMR